jgi:hypothetical protein
VDILGLELSNKILQELDIGNENIKNLCLNIKNDIFNFKKRKSGIIHNTMVRTKMRERKSDRIQDFFKIIISHFMIRFYTIF